jgi:hypothetical protein
MVISPPAPPVFRRRVRWSELADQAPDEAGHDPGIVLALLRRRAAPETRTTPRVRVGDGSCCCSRLGFGLSLPARRAWSRLLAGGCRWVARHALTDDGVVLGSRPSSGEPPVGAVAPPAAVLVDEVPATYIDSRACTMAGANHQRRTPPHPHPTESDLCELTGPGEASRARGGTNQAR